MEFALPGSGGFLFYWTGFIFLAMRKKQMNVNSDTEPREMTESEIMEYNKDPFSYNGYGQIKKPFSIKDLISQSDNNESIATSPDDYSKLLKHPKWQRKRLEIMQRDGFKCMLCGDEETSLHIHHKEYHYGKKPWEYEDLNFITLCEDCHSLVEIAKKSNSDILDSKILKIIGNNVKTAQRGIVFFISKPHGFNFTFLSGEKKLITSITFEEWYPAILDFLLKIKTNE